MRRRVLEAMAWFGGAFVLATGFGWCSAPPPPALATVRAAPPEPTPLPPPPPSSRTTPVPKACDPQSLPPGVPTGRLDETLDALVGQAPPWPGDYPDQRTIEDALALLGPVELFDGATPAVLETVDCSEYPCLVVYAFAAEPSSRGTRIVGSDNPVADTLRQLDLVVGSMSSRRDDVQLLVLALHDRMPDRAILARTWYRRAAIMERRFAAGGPVDVR